MLSSHAPATDLVDDGRKQRQHLGVARVRHVAHIIAEHRINQSRHEILDQRVEVCGRGKGGRIMVGHAIKTRRSNNRVGENTTFKIALENKNSDNKLETRR